MKNSSVFGFVIVLFSIIFSYMTTFMTHPNFSYMRGALGQKMPDLNIDTESNIREFPDTWPEIHFADPDKDIGGQNVVYLGDYSRPHHIFMNQCVVRGLVNYNARKVDIIVPFFPVGTNERIVKPGDVPTAKYLADMLVHIPKTPAGNTFHIIDIHALAEKFYFDDFSARTELHTAMDLIRAKLDSNTVIVFPDEGAMKRFGNAFPGIETVFCSKKRSGDNRTITIESGSDISGKNTLIIDDLIMSGGTLVETAKKLREMGAARVDAFATHGVFTGDALTRLSDSLDRLYTTDTIPANHDHIGSQANMTVLSIQSIVERILQKSL